MNFKNIITLIFLILSIKFVYCQGDTIPEKFIIHKVKKGDNLFNLAKKYNITESQIEIYNSRISKKGLRRRMQLRIPIYAKIEIEKVTPKKLEEYIVQPNDTKWRIAYIFGISIDELIKINPNIKDGISYGQTIMLPIKPKEEMNRLDTDFFYYKIKPKEGYYRIEIKTGFNKLIVDSLNPFVVSEGLKKGMILKLPNTLSSKLNVDKNLLLTEKISLQDSVFKKKKINIVYFLPFKTSVIEFNSLEKTERFLKRRTLTSIALDFYSGSILAMEKAKKNGIDVDAKIFDTQNKKIEIQKHINSLNPKKIDVIIGPMLPKNFNFLSQNEKLTDIPKVAPLSSNPVVMRKGVFQSVTPKSFIRNEMKKYLKNVINIEDNILIVSDSLNRKVEKELNFIFPGSIKLRPELGDFLLPELVDSLIVDTLPNKIILETEKFTLISSASSQIRSQLSEDKKITLFTTYHGASYEDSNLSNSLFGDLMFTYMSDYYPRNIDDSDLVDEFVNRFGIKPNKTSIRAFDLVYDLILRIATQNDLYSIGTVGETEYLNNKFNYVPDKGGSYINHGYYLLQHKDYDVLEINK